uniref:Putative secreted protein n=1 Tax=Anopheles darlingi TaxID=43151 RepID=A0A2M4DB28_ANODA
MMRLGFAFVAMMMAAGRWFRGLHSSLGSVLCPRREFRWPVALPLPAPAGAGPVAWTRARISVWSSFWTRCWVFTLSLWYDS